MTQTFEFKQSGHLDPALTDPATRTLNAEKLLGRWLNATSDTQGIAEIVIEQEGENFFVSAVGVGEGSAIVWQRTKATPLANLEEEAGQRTLALAVTFNFGFMKAESYLRINKGVLVIVAYHTFLDGSLRTNYLNREFFYRQT